MTPSPLVSRHLDALQIPHTIGGSIASSFPGEPRATIDIDFVVALDERQVDQLAAALLASPGLDVLAPTDRHPAVAEQVFMEVPQLVGNLVHDAHTAVLMREHGVRRIVTRDTDFHRFPFLAPVDPLV